MLNLINATYSMDLAREILFDFIETNYYIFSKETVLIGAITAPLYFLTKKCDNHIHKCFYDHNKHLNFYKTHRSAHKFAHYGEYAIAGALSTLSMCPEPRIQSTAKMLAIGFPYVYKLKLACRRKMPKLECFLRPKSEFFDKNSKFYNGFPSGHMTEIVYMLTLFGFSLGYKWAIPIGAYTAYVASDFLINNRHFASQLIAGIGIGATFGYASYKAVNNRVDEKISTNCSANGLCINYSY